MTTYAPETLPRDSELQATQRTAAAGGDIVTDTNARSILRFVNNSVGSRTITIEAQTLTRAGDASYPEQTIADISIVLAATEEAIIGPLPSAYRNGSNQIEFTYDDENAVVFEAFEVAS